MLFALRQTLCPLPPLSFLLQETVEGRLRLGDSRRRKRRPQQERLAELLRGWILG